MTPQARVQAAIELLDTIVRAARDAGPAGDTIIARYFAERRYAGSKDRRAVRELVYAAIRHAGERPTTGRSIMVAMAETDPELAALFDGSTHAPAVISPKEPRATPGIAPAWLIERLAKSGMSSETLPAMLERASLDIRVNTLLATRDDVVPAIPGAEPLPHAPNGIRLPAGTQVEQLELYNGGAIEVQDEGSQIVALATGAKPGDTLIDLCAGAGGKTLALAAMMENQGRIVACDTDRGRLQRLAPRATRAGVAIAESRLLDPNKEAEALEGLEGKADVVIIDAPCSGTGTWRRNPEARWRLNAERLERLTATQARLLDLGATLVKSGGSMTYIVCSLLDEEGADQVSRFLSAHGDWKADPLSLPAGTRRGTGIRLSPDRDGTDGFFVARLVRA
ncbi:RsmB/NOP family class I SAM-dependent RNA methyltransferase [soil metagenome]